MRDPMGRATPSVATVVALWVLCVIVPVAILIVANSISRLHGQFAELSASFASMRAHTEEADGTLTDLQRRLAAVGRATMDRRAELDELRRRHDALSARVDTLSDALAALELLVPTSVHADSAEAVADLNHKPSSPEALTLHAMATSSAPILLYDELPPYMQENFSPWKDRALFVAYPANRWGIVRYGRIAYEKRNAEIGLYSEYLNEENAPLLQRLAEIMYDIEAETESIIEAMFLAGRGLRFPDRESARAYVASLGLRSNNPYIRVDTSSGEAWVFPVDEVHESPRLVELRRMKDAVGKQLLNGSTGRYGANWIG